MEIEKTEAYRAHMDFVRGRLTGHKLDHVVSVAHTILGIAPRIGLDAERCATAALLHDACRALPHEELLARAHRYGLPVTEVQRAHPMLLHGPVAAEESRRELGIYDEDVYEAIYFHTTGRPNLHGIGQALYLADFSEPLRKYPQAAEARGILEREGFEKALLFAAECKLARVKDQDGEDPETRAFFEWLQREYA